MKLSVFTCCLCAFQIVAQGQEARQVDLPKVYEIVSDTIKLNELNSEFWQLLEDKSGQWSIEDVIKSPLVHKFHAIGEKAEGIDTNPTNTYWYRFRLKNTMSRAAKLARSPSVEYYDLYVFKSNNLSAHYRSGALRHWSEKDGLKFMPGAIPLVLQAGEEITIYERKQSKKPVPVGIYLWSTEKLIQEKYINYVESRTHIYEQIHLQEMFVVGFMLLTFFINLFCFWTVGDKAHLYFALFALTLCFNRFWNLAWDYSLWNAPEYLQYVPFISYFWFFIDWFLIQFFREFFSTKINYPRWDRWLLVVIIIHLALTGIALILQLYLGKLFEPLLSLLYFDQNYLIPLSIMIPLLTFVRGSDKSFMFVRLGAFPFMLLYFLLNDSGLGAVLLSEIFDPIAYHFRLIEIVCVSWLVLSFTWILFTRYAQTRKDNVQRALDNERLAKEKELERSQLIEAQKIELVKEVEERTKELRQSLAHLNVARSHAEQERRRAEASEAFKSRFLANMSHEIRTPLHGIAGFTDLVLETSLSEKQRRYLSAIHHSTERLTEVVNDILDISKLEAGEVKLRQVPFSPARIAHDVQDALSVRAENKGIELSVHVGEGVPAAVLGDPTRLYQILMNLAGNALKFTEKGEVRLTVDSLPRAIGGGRETVDGSPAHALTSLTFSLADTGIGIPAEKLSTIFDSFQQASDDTTAHFGGTGLGLTIARELLQLHSSDIQVKSEVGKGSTFSFTLSLPLADAADMEQAGSTGGGLYFTQKLKILLADDNAFNREIATEALLRHFENAEIVEVGDGLAAVETLHATSQPGFNLILMDMQMPEMNGTEATRHIRQQLGSDIPIIALTASATPEEIEKALESGMNRHLAKPFKPMELAKAIAEVLGLKVGPIQIQSKLPSPQLKTQNPKLKTPYDLAYLRDFCDGDEAQVQHFIQKFEAQCPLEIERLEAALERQDLEAIYQAAHSFKPQLEFVGWREMAAVIAELEHGARAEQPIETMTALVMQLKGLLRFPAVFSQNVQP